jgi:hypothetical protein
LKPKARALAITIFEYLAPGFNPELPDENTIFIGFGN